MDQTPISRGFRSRRQEQAPKNRIPPGLDELDQELERRGHRFVRYADDCNIYVRRERAGQRVMESITRFITQKLKLKVNEAKSAVARPQERKFLGFSFTAGSDMPIQADGAHEGGARDLIVAEIVDLDAAGVDVAQDHVVFATAAEIAETHDLPIHSHSAQECGVGDVVVAES
jgi:hypothetical protein